MTALLVVYGRIGDIVSSMVAASCASEVHGASVYLLVHEKYRETAEMLMSDGAPISGVVTTRVESPTLDTHTSGLNLSRLSGCMLKNLFPGYDSYLNCAPRLVPKGVRISSFMAYCAGVSRSIDASPRGFPVLHGALRRRSPSKKVCFHFGSSDPSRSIKQVERMCDGFTTVCLGGKDDPCPEWIDVDMRGATIRDSVEEILTSASVCGTDSAFTHLSGIYGIPTVCIHNSAYAAEVYDRRVYGDRCISVLEMEMFKNAAEASVRYIAQ